MSILGGNMYIEGAFVSVMKAQDVANVLQDFLNEQRESQYFKLEVRNSNDTERQEFYVKPLSEALFDIEDGRQVVQCTTMEGRSVLIIVPPGPRGESQFASVLLGRDCA
ncbi:MAG TPA: hypothetical protein VFK03_00475 [Candidatus Saccharimonadales bacterium]|nr:hypothetical protein [Candidatus Saccharimonadales bacterium]